MELPITHDEKKHRFFCALNGKECSVDYEVQATADDVLSIYRTYVHPDLRGKGIADSLLKSLTGYAITKGLRVRPLCSYAVRYYRRHPEHANLLNSDVSLDDGGSCRVA
ncbi:MAG: N-acetyltransferase [Chitinivibrionales bacterium]|nr:N-acetyltransferase [Chitinivibrionales bacterium]